MKRCYHPRSFWEGEVESIRAALAKDQTLEEIGSRYSLSKQGMYQVLGRLNLHTFCKKQKEFRDQSHKARWLTKALGNKVPRSIRIKTLEALVPLIPDVCPILGIPLDFGPCLDSKRRENAPSLDQIKPGKGYELDNVQVISWRANRIKNDSTPEELMKIATYMCTLAK